MADRTVCHGYVRSIRRDGHNIGLPSFNIKLIPFRLDPSVSIIKRHFTLNEILSLEQAIFEVEAHLVCRLMGATNVGDFKCPYSPVTFLDLP